MDEDGLADAVEAHLAGYLELSHTLGNMLVAVQFLQTVRREGESPVLDESAWTDLVARAEGLRRLKRQVDQTAKAIAAFDPERPGYRRDHRRR